MARRGRFGRSETGASDLSATIRSLVQQQAAQDEQVFMKAFYDGTEYNGKIPTMDDVIAFYERIANLSGIARDSEQWTFFEQKIGDANNFDLKRSYNAIIAEYNASNGANYGDVIDFLSNRATTSTDQGDLQDYAAAIDSVTSAYLKYQGQALTRGEMTAKEYQSVVMQAIQVLDPGTDAYKSAVYDAMTYEWNAESTKWQNRIRAGTATPGQFKAWADRFSSRVLGSGVNKDSELYTSIGATVASAMGSSGGSAAKDRVKKVTNDINDIWSTITGQVGGGSADIIGTETVSEDSLLKDIKKNADYAPMYAEWIDNHPGMVPQYLRDAGVQTGDDFLDLWNKKLDKGFSVAQAAAATGLDVNTKAWAEVNVYAGGYGVWAQTKYADSQWQKDRANANGSDVLLQSYDKEYAKYLLGLDSYYGQMAYQPNAEELARINNQIAAMGYAYDAKTNEVTYVGAKYDPNAANVSTSGEDGKSLSDANKNLETIDPTARNSALIQNGLMIDEWVVDESLPGGGLYVARPPITGGAGGGFNTGVYQYIKIDRLPGGGTYAHAVYSKGTPIYLEDGMTPSGKFLYNLESGSTIIDAAGKQYSVSGVRLNANGEYQFVPMEAQPQEVGDAPRSDFSALERTRTQQEVMGVSGDSLLERNAVLDQALAQEIRDAEGKAALAANAIDPQQREAVMNDVTGLGAQANQIEANALSIISSNTTDAALADATRAKIAQLSGTEQERAFWQGEKNFYTETAPGSNVWQIKPEYMTTTGTVDPIAKVGIAALTPIPGAAGIASIIAGASALFGGTPIEKRVLDFRTQEQKDAEEAVGLKAAAPQIAAFERTGYGQAPGSTFFRNLTPPAPAVAPMTPGVNSYMSLQANIAVPRPKTLTTLIPPAVNPVKLQSVAGDSLAERRAQLARNPNAALRPLATAQPLPKPVRGGQ